MRKRAIIYVLPRDVNIIVYKYIWDYYIRKVHKQLLCFTILIRINLKDPMYIYIANTKDIVDIHSVGKCPSCPHWTIYSGSYDKKYREEYCTYMH
jgi:hypothetical protein